MMFFEKSSQKGAIFIYLLIIIAIFAIVTFPLATLYLAKLQVMKTLIVKEQAFQITEAGINYYQWHFAQFPTDYQDGGLYNCSGQGGVPCPSCGSANGPYRHAYVDFDTQETIGYFDLCITMPPTGTTVRTIQSTGWSVSNKNFKRTITAQYAILSASQYALLTTFPAVALDDENGDVAVKGKVRTTSGIGVRSSGEGANSIISESASYSCPQRYQSPCPTTEPGVWGPNGPLIPNPIPPTPNPPAWAKYVQFPAAPYNVNWPPSGWPATTVWANMISDSFMQSLEPLADANKSLHSLTPADVSASYVGYFLKFNDTTPGTYDLYKVKAGTDSAPGGYYWDLITTQYRHTDITNYNDSNKLRVLCSAISGASCSGDSFLYPQNGVIFFNSCTTTCVNGVCANTNCNPNVGNFWVSGTVNGRVTIAAANFPYTAVNGDDYENPSIFISDNLVYKSTDGSCALGIISQKYILISHNAPDNIIIHGALATQYNSIGRLNYEDEMNPAINKGSVTTYGALISKGENDFGYCSPCHGYTSWNLNYDNNLQYYPPPHFPTSSSGTYQLIFWTSD